MAIWWISASLCNAGKIRTLPALSPKSLEDGCRVSLYFIPGAMARAVQPSRAGAAGRGVLRGLGDCQGNPVEGVCAGQSGLATSLLRYSHQAQKGALECDTGARSSRPP